MTTLDSSLLRPLEALGFTETKAVIYLTTLKEGPVSAWTLSKLTHIKRPTCYAALDELIEDGYANKTNDGRRTLYSVITPREIQQILERKQEEFRIALTLLEGYGNKSNKKPTVRLYEGWEGIKQVLGLALLQPPDSEILIWSANLLDKIPAFSKVFHNELKEKGIKIKMLVSDTPTNRRYFPSRLEEIVYVPTENFRPTTETYVFSNLIVHISPLEPNPFATVIESHILAEEERQTFHTMWRLLNL